MVQFVLNFPSNTATKPFKYCYECGSLYNPQTDSKIHAELHARKGKRLKARFQVSKNIFIYEGGPSRREILYGEKWPSAGCNAVSKGADLVISDLWASDEHSKNMLLSEIKRLFKCYEIRRGSEESCKLQC